ncbi:MAG TPA: aconitate hydratase [bacterium]|nr:aconitate hydratase [bacterium]
MKGTLASKVLQDHLVEGTLEPGQEIGIRIDHCLLQDATGTMADLQFEALDIPRVKCELAVSYVDHNMLQTGFENMDDHVFLQTFAKAHGIIFSKPGNGICHQVHLERFSIPGKTLLGADSHTPTCGGAGMIAIGAGGLDVAVAMGGGPFYTVCPKILGVRLIGKLQPWVTAKDIILEVLRRISVKGGVGRIIEYHGPGIASLHVPERGTITNMGAETGATCSVFASDDVTRRYLKMQGREKDYRPLAPDADAEYEELIEIVLDKLEPLVAKPQSPDAVAKVKDTDVPVVRQVNIGSCTNSSFRELMVCAKMLEGKKVPEHVSFNITPGSRQVLRMLAESGALAIFVAAGARILESACDGCIGMGSAPGTGVHSVRSYNRNFPGRSGVKDDHVYLVSPETAAATAIRGKLTDPREMGEYPRAPWPDSFIIDDAMLVPPAADPKSVEIVRGPNIRPLPLKTPVKDSVEGEVLLKVGDNITTDHIMPAGPKILPFRSNIPAIAEFVYVNLDPTFVARCKQAGGGFILGGSNYGQGSSREHAALAPMFLGIQAVFAKSFARIHKANLINFGIVPLELPDDDYDAIEQGDRIRIEDVRKALEAGRAPKVVNVTRNKELKPGVALTARNVKVLLAGGLLNYIKSQAK